MAKLKDFTDGPIRAVVVSVEYDDYLDATLPRLLPHVDEVLVVTTPEDTCTQLVADLHGATYLPTTVFYAAGASLNKGAAIERGLDELMPESWVLVIDADIVMPEDIALSATVSRSNLYSTQRRILRRCVMRDDGRGIEVPRDETWKEYPVYRDTEMAGYFHLFHGGSLRLPAPPWYGSNWTHAGGCDSDFINFWPRESQVYLPFDVLHLGTPFLNWHGRTTPWVDGIKPARAADRREKMKQMSTDRQRLGTYEREKIRPDA